MLLLELTLHNYGVFKGHQVFNLRPERGNIILFGGKNGTGKTTLLESIRVCLYGQMGLGYRTRKSEYDKHIATRFHRARYGEKTKAAGVSLQFEYAQFGKKYSYRISRSWVLENGKIQEIFKIVGDDGKLEELPEENWPDFVQDLIPIGLAELFFFDGEKIQDLATDQDGDHTLADAMKQMLNLNLVEQLQADLGIYSRQRLKEMATKAELKSLDQGRALLAKKDVELSELREKRAQLENSIRLTNGRMEKAERDINRESGGYHKSREALKNELKQKSVGREVINQEIREMAAGLLPFTLVPELCAELVTQMEEEHRCQQWQAGAQILEPGVQKINDALANKAFWESTAADKQTQETVKAKLGSLMDNLCQMPDSLRNTALIHNQSEAKRLQLLQWISLTDNEYDIALKKRTELEALVSQERKVSLKLKQVPKNNELEGLVKDLMTESKHLGELQSVANQKDIKIRSEEFKRKELKGQLDRVYESMREGQAEKRRLNLIDKVQGVLDVYLKRLTSAKIHDLADLIVARFGDIGRKPDLLHRVEIDPDSFQVQLFGSENTPLPKDQLSAGEKQMFSISILWALRQLSGRPLPVVIDTPLGRLDSEHRQHLIEKYFPHTSHQVILFSTDTEINEEYFEQLAPELSDAYHLIYDSDSGSTRVEKGYFWQEAEFAVQ